MKKLLISSSAAALLVPTIASADPTWMLGLGISFGGNQAPSYAVTANVLSDDEPDEFVVGAGVNYYLDTNSFGAGVGVGYLFDNSALMLGYDFVQGAANLSLGYAPTASGDSSVQPTTTGGPITTPTTTGVIVIGP